MKNLIIALLIFTGIQQTQAQKTTATFKVEGNCEMCEVRIEKAAKSVKGVSKADWDLKSKVIAVTFDSTKTDLSQIHQSISDMGYKTDQLAATKKGYNALPFCCKVDGACEPKK